MSPHESDRRHFERQLVYARPIIVLLALLALFEQPHSNGRQRSIYFLVAYFLVSLVMIQIERLIRKGSWHLPLVWDLLALGIFWGLDAALPLAGALSLLLVLLTAHRGEIQWMRVVAWLGLTGGTFAGGAGLAFLGDRSRRFASEGEFFSRIVGTLQVDQGLAESLRLLLDELATAFLVEEALLAYRDLDLERIFLWRLKAGEGERLLPESFPIARADDFLLDDMDATICWNSLAGAGRGFGWDRRDGRRLKSLPRLPGRAQQELKLRSMMSVAFDQAGQPAGRIFLVNSRKPFERADLYWLERISRHVGPSLENVFLLRHLRARAIEGERSRISRDLHDGILQTLLSIEIQLDVLRRVRVQSADLVDLMRGFAERYRNESSLALDLLLDSADLRAPDRVCREVFQIYREALNNIKKHAKATHVVVKLSQDDSRLLLVV